VAAGIRQGRLVAGRPIEVQTRGGTLSIQWSGELSDSVMMTGSAEPVYEGVIVL
jgi:diaminopimelate epimerase